MTFEIKDLKTRLVVASNLTAAYYASLPPQFGIPENTDEQQKICDKIIAKLWGFNFDLTPDKRSPQEGI